MRLAIIAGTGVNCADLAPNPVSFTIDTPYGPAALLRSNQHDTEILLLMRHGPGHHVPPHRINYRANIWALHSLGVEGVIATSAVGSLRKDLSPGTLVLVNSFLDFTSGRAATFFDGDDNRVVHTDMTYPYCEGLRSLLSQVSARQGVTVHSDGCYVCTNGPRFETAAEIRAYSLLGGDIIGMTGVPEVVLARELGICYASIALVTNLGAGLGDGLLSHNEVVQAMRAAGERITAILHGVLLEAPRASSCAEILRGSKAPTEILRGSNKPEHRICGSPAT